VSSERDTRDRILQSARELLEARGYHNVGLEEIARAAGVSRQAVYLHFQSKAKLLLALVEWVDQRENLARRFRPIATERDPVVALELLVQLAMRYAPRIHPLAMVLESARRSDPDAAAAWDDRMSQRRAHCRAIVKALADSGRLRKEWTVETATDFVWTLIAVQTFEVVTAGCGWSPARAAKLLSGVAVRALVA
jgi:AcrR family transcriptional regulator